MSASKTTPAAPTDDAEQSEKRSILSPVQVAAGALAAVSSAVVASLFGVAGTLIGAAVASVISTVSAALYSESLNRTNERLRQARSRLSGQGRGPAEDPDATRVLPAALDPRRAPVRWRPRWSRIAAGAVAVFGLAMGIVTGVEIIGQQPVSALVGDSSTTKTTTLGALTNVASHRDETPTTPRSPATSTPTTSSTESTPTGGPSEASTDEPDSVDQQETERSESTPTGSASRSAQPTDSSGELSEGIQVPAAGQPTVP